MTDRIIRISPHAMFWIIVFVVLAASLIFFSEILLPFAAGAVIAYLFQPLVNRMTRAGIARSVAAFAIVAMVSLLLIAIFALIVPPVLNQLGQLVQKAPSYVEQMRGYLLQHYGQYIEPMRDQLGQQPAGQPKPDVSQQIAQNAAPWLASQLQGLVTSGLALFNSLALLFLTPVVAFFLLRDWNGMIEKIDKLLPRQDAPVIRQIAGEIDDTISAYLRGTLTVLLILSAFYMVALGLIGLNYGLLIGLGAGLISFIPYVGATAGFLVAGTVATAQFWPNYTSIGIVLGIFIIGQIIEGNVLTPKIVGDKVGVHPVWLIFALIASGYVLGFTGLLIAVPLAAAIGVLIRHAVQEYYDSDVYNERKSKPVATRAEV